MIEQFFMAIFYMLSSCPAVLDNYVFTEYGDTLFLILNIIHVLFALGLIYYVQKSPIFTADDKGMIIGITIVMALPFVWAIPIVGQIAEIILLVRLYMYAIRPYLAKRAEIRRLEASIDASSPLSRYKQKLAT